MNQLVSIIIPCFNAEKWLKEAIDSCLKQTYPAIEIIIIDDGSSDRSLDIVKSYGETVIYESGPNRGPAYARNRGFALSKGSYIQYLDADDYLLPEKIERQVCCLVTTKADVVYSDFRYQKYLLDDTSVLSEAIVCQPQEDILNILLSCDLFLQTSNPLFTREAIIKGGEWDKNCHASDDVDFFRSIAINGMKFIYQPGCYTIHREYQSNDRVTANQAIGWKSHLIAAEKAEKQLQQFNKLSTSYKQSLARAYFRIALFGCCYFNYSKYLKILKKITSLDPAFHPHSSILRNGKLIYNLLNNIFGFLPAGIVYKFFKDFNLYFLKMFGQKAETIYSNQE